MSYRFGHDGYDISKLDQDLVKQAQSGSQWDHNDQARYDKLVAAKQNSQSGNSQKTQKSTTQSIQNGSSMTNRAEARQERQDQRKAQYQANQEQRAAQYEARQAAKKRAAAAKGSTGKPTNAIDDTTTGAADSVYSNLETIQAQNVNQDNDINSTVTGNDNTVINEQDNSVRFYGGNTRNFVYNGSKGGLTGGDSPVSMATMAGFYAPDDSPAAQAKFVDMYTTMNRDNQKRYAGDAMKTYAKYGNIDARSYTDESMENTINRGIQYSFDRADRQTGHVFGDIWNPNYITEKWQMPDPPKEIESNAADIAKDAKDDIEDI